MLPLPASLQRRRKAAAPLGALLMCGLVAGWVGLLSLNEHLKYNKGMLSSNLQSPNSGNYGALAGRELMASAAGGCCVSERGCNSGLTCGKSFTGASKTEGSTTTFTLTCSQQGLCTDVDKLDRVKDLEDETNIQSFSYYNSSSRLSSSSCCAKSDQCKGNEHCEGLCCKVLDAGKTAADCTAKQRVAFPVTIGGVQHVSCCRVASSCDDDESTTGHCQPWSEDTFSSCSRDPEGSYPPDLFTCKEKKSGAIILHTIGMVYMFFALAIVCDDYFVPALEVLVERWAIKEDVAGATFMAAGGSAPELFTSVIGVFFAQNDVGFGTIVGSAVFNILLVIGACSVAAGKSLDLTWWPLARDATYYGISILTLYLVVINDNGSEITLTNADEQAIVAGKLTESNKGRSVIVFWEALVLLFLYVGYVVLMKYNEKLEKWVKRKLAARKRAKAAKPKESKKKSEGRESPKVAPEPPVVVDSGANDKSATNEVQATSGAGGNGGDRLENITRSPTPNKSGASLPAISDDGAAGSSSTPQGTSTQPDENSVTSMKAAAIKMQMRLARGGASSPAKKFSLAAALVMEQVKARKAYGRRAMMRAVHEDEKKAGKTLAMQPAATAKDEGSKPADDDDDDEISNPFEIPKGFGAQVWWAINFPINIVLWGSLPDCKNPARHKWYMFTFFASVLWIGFFSFWMVWWATELCYVIGLPIPVMGLTVLAAGTSVPDLLTSVIVAKRGLGDMAVSSSIGSNIFDLCMGLPLPWFLATAIVAPASTGDLGYVRIGSESMEFSLMMLFGLLAVTILSIVGFGWSINRRMGIIMFSLYFLFMALSLMAEYEVIIVDISGSRADGTC